MTFQRDNPSKLNKQNKPNKPKKQEFIDE